MAGLHLTDDGPEFTRLGFVNHVGAVNSGNGTVGGDLHHIQMVDGGKFFLFCQRSTGHTGQLFVQTEVVLEGNGGKGLALTGDLYLFFGFNGLVQTLVVPAAVHQSAGELVNNDNLPVLNDVVDIPFHNAPGLHGLVDMVRNGGIFRVGKVFNAEKFLRFFNTAGSEGYGTGLFVHDVVAIVIVVYFLVLGLGKDHLLHTGNQEVCHFVQFGRILALAGDNQRRSCLVDQNGVHLVHDGKGVSSLDKLGFVNCHIITKVVKAQFVIGAIGNIGGISLPPLVGTHTRHYQPHRQTHKFMDLTHPLGVTGGKVVVDSDHVDAGPCQRVQIAGQNGNQCLTFTGLHFCDSSLMEHDTANELYRVGAHTQHTPGGLPNGGECLGQNVVQGFTVIKPLLKFCGLSLKFLLREGLVFFFQG